MTDLPVTGLSYIEVQDSNPFLLFNKWKEEVDENVNDPDVLCNSNWLKNAFCLATTAANGQSRSRNVVLKEIDDDGFIFVTDKRGGKMKDIEANPKVGATFLWHYKMDNMILIVKQIRIEGVIYLLDQNHTQKLYDSEMPYGKIRSNLCHQGVEIKWEDHKANCDQLVRKYINKETDLPKPDHYIGLKIVPNRMEFYLTEGNCLGDRLVFTKTGNTWKYIRIDT